jgi:hypothetical protein
MIKLITENEKIKLTAPSGGGAVFSVNGKVGEVVLNAADIGALPADTLIPSIEGLASEKYVDDKIAAIPKTDLTDYAKKADLVGFATEQFVKDAIDDIEIKEVDLTPYAKKTDLANYATKTYVTQQIAAIPAPDLSAYAKTAELNSYAKKSDIKGMATESYVNQQIAAIPKTDLSGYATEDYVDEAIANASIGGGEVDLSNYATKKFVEDAIKAIEIPEAPDLSEYAKKSDIPSLDGYAKTSDIPDVSKYQTEEQVNALINAAMATLVDAEGVEY